MTIYIAGPMTGIKDYNRPAFFDAAKRCEEAGFTVINPAVLPVDLPERSYAPICTAMIDAADAVYLLDGFEKSVGARAEKQYAKWQGKILLFEEFHRTPAQLRRAIEKKGE